MKVIVHLDGSSEFCAVYGPYENEKLDEDMRELQRLFGSMYGTDFVSAEMRYPQSSDLWTEHRMLHEFERHHRVNCKQLERLKASGKMWAIVVSADGRGCRVFGPYTKEIADILIDNLQDIYGGYLHVCPRQVELMPWSKKEAR